MAASLRIMGGHAVQAQRLHQGWEGHGRIDARLVREVRRADVVHVFSASYSAFLVAVLPAVLIARLFGRPVILNDHSGEAPDHLQRSAVARYVMRNWVDLNVVPSPFLRDVLGSFDIAARTVPNTIDVRLFPYRVREPLGPRLLSTRNFEPIYNVASVLRAFARVQTRHPRASLVLVGSGSQEAPLRALARELDLRDVTSPAAFLRRRSPGTTPARISWTWGLHFLLADAGADDDQPWLVDMFVALDRQLTHVERNLSVYFSPNTHLTGEALALYVVGVALPELAASRRWADTGRRVLLSEIDRQIRGDGGHVERSTHYQRYTLDFYLMALLTAEREGDEEAMSRFTDAVRRLAEFTRTMADDRGYLPLIGDDDGGMLWPFAGRACRDVRDSLALAAVVLDRPDLAPWGMQEEVVWIAGRRAIEQGPLLDRTHAATPPMGSRTLAGTGYVVARDSAGSHAVFDVGPHGHLSWSIRGRPPIRRIGGSATGCAAA